MHGAQSTFLAGLPPNRRVSPSPCCHSPNSPMACWPQGAWGIPIASCAPHRANGVEGVRGWGDAISFWVGRRPKRISNQLSSYRETTRNASGMPTTSCQAQLELMSILHLQTRSQTECIRPPLSQHASSCRSQDARLTMHGAQSTFLAGLPPNRRVSPSPCCHSPNSPMACWPQGAWGIPIASCAPHRANGVEGVRGWGDAISFWVGRRPKRISNQLSSYRETTRKASGMPTTSCQAQLELMSILHLQTRSQTECLRPPLSQHASSCRSQDARLTVHGAQSTFLAGLLPNRRVSPSPGCHSPNSPMARWPQGAWGIPIASCAPHRANGVEGVRGWGDAISFRVGRRPKRIEARSFRTTRNADGILEDRSDRYKRNVQTTQGFVSRSYINSYNIILYKYIYIYKYRSVCIYDIDAKIVYMFLFAPIIRMIASSSSSTGLEE